MGGSGSYLLVQLLDTPSSCEGRYTDGSPCSLAPPVQTERGRTQSFELLCCLGRGEGGERKERKEREGKWREEMYGVMYPLLMRVSYFVCGTSCISSRCSVS